MPVLPLLDMASRHYGLTETTAANYLEAARVCFDRHYNPPIEILIENENNCLAISVEWEITDTRTRNAWNNVTDTTEAGAYACALAALEVAEGLVTIMRAETMTGSDYYVAPIGTDSIDLESALRFEVAGRNIESRSQLLSTLQTKLDQARRGNSNLPAIAGVVGFHEKLVLLKRI